MGKATAKQFARESAKVAICALSNLIDQAAAEITSETNQDILAIRADVAPKLIRNSLSYQVVILNYMNC
ncbi:hypothetical protein [Gloeocapsopsis dulcis]|uniref:hypothetical protein n=1 Tax=Gloeocapsopsis dulcis TaxID=2859516 RepID=UPI00101AD970